MNKMLITIFGGWFGLHHYMDRRVGLGILYTFTGGLCGIGWLYDSYKAVMEYLGSQKTTPTPSKPTTSTKILEVELNAKNMKLYDALHDYIKKNYEICKDELFGGYSNDEIMSMGKVYEVEDFTISGSFEFNDEWQFLYNDEVIGNVDSKYNYELNSIINSDMFVNAKCVINGGRYKYYDDEHNKVEIGKEPLRAKIKVIYKA